LSTIPAAGAPRAPIRDCVPNQIRSATAVTASRTGNRDRDTPLSSPLLFPLEFARSDVGINAANYTRALEFDGCKRKASTKKGHEISRSKPIGVKSLPGPVVTFVLDGFVLPEAPLVHCRQQSL